MKVRERGWLKRLYDCVGYFNFFSFLGELSLKQEKRFLNDLFPIEASFLRISFNIKEGMKLLFSVRIFFVYCKKIFDSVDEMTIALYSCRK